MRITFKRFKKTAHYKYERDLNNGYTQILYKSKITNKILKHILPG